MAKRKIIQIDQEKCDGCGQCVPGCAEGAIKVVAGKARLVSEVYCDGLGACLGECPQGAISMVEREAAEFDEAAVQRHLAKASAARPPIPILEPLFQGCPSSRMPRFEAAPGAVPESLAAAPAPAAQLRNWPVQLHLVPVRAPYFDHARLLLAADCVPFAFPDFHRQLLQDHVLLIACPKLDNVAAYRSKLAQIFTQNVLQSIEIAYMEVPCCGGLVRLVQETLEASGINLPVTLIQVGIRGEILNRQPARWPAGPLVKA